MGKPAARIADMHVCPMFDGPKPHVGGPIVGPGVPTVLIGGMPAATLGDMCTCAGPPDTIILGSVGVMIGGKPAARMGDMCAHGGTIVVGCPTVLIGEVMPGAIVNSAVISSVFIVLEQMFTEFPDHTIIIAAQVTALIQASTKGVPFCAICEKEKI